MLKEVYGKITSVEFGKICSDQYLIGVYLEFRFDEEVLFREVVILYIMRVKWGKITRKKE